MSEITKLVYATSIDSSGWLKGLDEGQKGLEDFHKGAVGKLENISIGMPSIEMGSGTAQLASTLLPLGSKIQAALGSTISMVAPFAAEFRSNFNNVGATVEKLAIRIDSAMRFPVFLKRAESFRKGLLKITLNTVRESADELDKGLNRPVDASKLTASFKTARKQIMQTVAPIPGDIGYALQSAVHVDAKASFGSYLKGLDDVKSAAVDKMKAMADAVANATGKGSRVGRRNASAKAADLGQTINSVPPRQNSTSASAGFVPPAPIPFLPPAFTKALDQGKLSAQGLGKALSLDVANGMYGVRAIADGVANHLRLLGLAGSAATGLFVGFQKLGSSISSVGSVANATFPSLKKLGAAVPKLSFDPRQSMVIKGIGGAANSAAGGMKNFATQAMMALGLFGFAFKAVEFLGKGIKGASDLNETVSKTDVILGEGSGKVKAFADTMASQFGMVKGTTLDVASSFAGLGKSLGGLSGGKLADFSMQTTKLAADLSSFSNIDMGEAASAIQTGLAGNQSDKLKQLGVILTEDTLKQYAYAHGIAVAGQELNEQQKFMARSALITQGLAKASGDLERTQGGAANQGRKLMGTISNIGTTIGTALLPIITEGLVLFNEFGSFLVKSFEESKATIESWTNTLLDGFDYVIATVHNFPAAFNMARLKIVEVLTNIGEWITVLGPNAVTVAQYIGRNWLLLIGDAFEGTVTGLKNLWKNFQSIGKAIFEWLKDPTQGFQINWTPMLEGFRATSEKFPELLKPVLTDMSKEIGAAASPILDEVAKRRDDRLKAKAAPKVVDQGNAVAGEEAKKKDKKKAGSKDKEGGEVKFAGALELGSKEAYSAVVAAGAKPSASLEESNKQTASNTAMMVKLLSGPKAKGRHAQKKALVINA